jgi:hypothetical protein
LLFEAQFIFFGALVARWGIVFVAQVSVVRLFRRIDRSLGNWFCRSCEQICFLKRSLLFSAHWSLVGVLFLSLK